MISSDDLVPGGARYRLVYQVQDDVLIVLVLTVAKREDMAVYRAAIQRILR